MEKAALQLADIHELVAVAAELDLPLDVVSEEIVLCLPTSATNQSIYGSLNPLLDCRPYAIEALDESKLYNKSCDCLSSRSTGSEDFGNSFSNQREI